MFKSYSEVIAWLLQMSPLAQAQALSHLHQVKTLIQHPTLRPTCPIITITGTNGKGSTVHTLSAIFTQAGYKVGSFTSPHLCVFNERIAINGHAIGDHDFTQAALAVSHLKIACPPHFFSTLLLMALWHFKHQRVDILILEVGLGGRLDSCNALDATILGITSIALDHTRLLGATREHIAHEKACLMRKGRWCIVGDPYPPDAINTYASGIDAPLRCIGSDFSYLNTGPNTFSWQGAQWLLNDLPKPRVLLSNLAVALAIIEALHTLLPVTLAAIRTALTQLTIPGRYQYVHYRGKTILLDVAHNPASIENLLQQLQVDSPKKSIHLIFGIMQDKDWRQCFERLMTLNVHHCYFPNLQDPRALDTTVLHLAAMEKNQACSTYPSVDAALAAALTNVTEQQLIIVTGSFHTVGEVLAKLKITR